MTAAVPAPVYNPTPAETEQALGPAMGFTTEHIEALYGLAHTFYTQQLYDKAEKVFGALCLCDHRQDRFWIGLGACRQHREDYTGAIGAYAMVDYLGVRNPVAPLRAAECYVALGNYELALSGLNTALDWVELRSENGSLIKRVDQLTALIKQRLAARSAAGASEL